MEAALTGRPDVHAGSLADRLEALEDLDRGRVVLDPEGWCGGVWLAGIDGSFVGHAHLFATGHPNGLGPDPAWR
jgi:hypothetical protein